MVDATSTPGPDPLPAHRRRWLLLTGLLVLVAVAGVVVLALSTAEGPLDRGTPVYLALSASGLAAIGAFILTFAHTFHEHLSPSTKRAPQRG